MIEAILRDDGIHLADLSSVRLVRLGSAPVLPGLYQRIAVILPYAAILVGYGTTESGPVTSVRIRTVCRCRRFPMVIRIRKSMSV